MPSERPNPYLMLGVVKETDAGIMVRGARMLATLTPMPEASAVYPLTVKLHCLGYDDTPVAPYHGEGVV